ncbi:MAG: hypothetical protein RIF41_27050 [Polyangiaceae bacterium]
MNAQELAALLTSAVRALAPHVPPDDFDAVLALGLVDVTAEVLEADVEGADLLADAVWWKVEAR